MHLVYKALEKKAIPSALPIELLNRSNRNVLDLTSKIQFSTIPASEFIPSNIGSSELVNEIKTAEVKHKYFICIYSICFKLKNVCSHLNLNS